MSSKPRPSMAAPILAVLAIVLVTLGAYVGGYFGLGNATPCIETQNRQGVVVEVPCIERVYSQRWLATAFAPAALIETLLRPEQVTTASEPAQEW